MRPTDQTCFIVGIMLLVFALTTWGLSGCTEFSVADLRGQVDQAQVINDGILAQVQVALGAKTEVDADIATMPPGPKREKLEQASATLGVTIDTGIAWLDRANASLEQMKVRLATAENPEDVAVAAAETAAPWIPQPYGTALVGLVGLSAGLIRAYRNKKAGKGLAVSVQPAVDVYFAIESNSNDNKLAALNRQTKIISAQTEATRRLVAEARGKKFSLPF